MTTQVQLDEQTTKNLHSWLDGDYDEQVKNELKRMLADDPKAIVDAFYTTLSFGTGGLRGIMGLGTNRISDYTIRAVTQGLANYLKKAVKHQPKILIGYDSRLNSREFAIEAASVLAGNDIAVLIYEELRPVPMVSFGCLEEKCDAAVMITASHNPPQYNGYKVYWSNGVQVLPPHDVGIIEEVNRIKGPKQVRTAKKDSPLIKWIGTELDARYLKKTTPLQCYPAQNRQRGHELKVVYTALHGAGITMVPKSLKNWGFTQVLGVEEQNSPDGHFPTIKSPNPEEHAAMKLGVDRLTASQSDLLLGTDADTDRVGAVVLHHGEPVFLDGNQMAAICLDHILRARSSQGKLSPRAAAVKTIVTTELFTAIGNHYGCHVVDVLTGFKYIGQLIDEWEQHPDRGFEFVYGAEESYGCLVGTHARDKDAIIACSLLCEVALDAKLKGETLVDRLESLYRQHGIWRENLESITLIGKEGAEKITGMMASLRKSPPQSFGSQKVVRVEDYQLSEERDLKTGAVTRINLPTSNVLRFWLADGTKLVVRPSGTEPKIKIYSGIKMPFSLPVEAAIQEADARAKATVESLKKMI